MDRSAKRRRVHEPTADDQAGPVPQASSSRQEHHHESNHFVGNGLQHQNGNLHVNGDLIIGNPATLNDTYDHRKSLLESLAFDQIDSRQASIKKALRNTCQWFLQTPVYKEWEDKDSSQDNNHFLWIKGKPGAGKSTLMKFLYLHLQTKSKKDNNLLVSFFFNARGHALEQSTVGLYRSLLVQLFEKRPDLLDMIDIPRRGRDWDLESLKDLFEQAIQSLGQTPVTCLVDALDECEQEQVRAMVRYLSKMVCTENRLSICFASRHYPHITIQTGLSMILEDQDKHQDDIAMYLDEALDIGDNDFAKKIRLGLQKKASGVFMWVVLVVDILNKEYEDGRQHTLEEKLDDLPTNLHELFKRILTRDTNHQGALLLCIQWVLFARQPLTPKQLYFAILSGYEPQHLKTCHSDNISDEVIYKYILTHSKGVVESTKGKTSTIQFIHESVRDFLLKEGGLDQIFPILEGNIHGQSHNALKHCCIAYMNASTKVEAEPQDPTAKITKPKLPFLEYAIYNILYHAEQAERNSVSQLEFLAQFPRQEWIRQRNLFEKYKSRHYTPNASISYILAEFDTTALIRACPSRRSLLDVEDERYGLPILAAMATKSSAAVQTMLEIEADQSAKVSWTYFQSLIPDSQNGFLSTPTRDFNFNRKRNVIDEILMHNCEALILFLLLAGDVDINSKDGNGRGLLEIATTEGYSVLFDEILKIHPGALTVDSSSQLLFQAANGAVTKILLERGADPLVVNTKGRTPLHEYVMETRVKKWFEVVNVLINTRVGLSVIDNEGWTPLLSACKLAEPGYSQSMGTAAASAASAALLLIEAGADISIADKEGRTPLHHTSNRRRVDIARKLMEHDADVSIVDNEGKTPLHINASYPFPDTNNLEITKQLIERGAGMSIIDKEGKTPLHYASSPHGSLEVAKQLIERGADISIIDKEGKTPLHYASFPHGSLEVAKQLIERGADISIIDKEGKTPLHYASSSSYGGSEVAKELIERGADISIIDKEGKTPLHYASSSYGYPEVAKKLIERGAEISIIDKEGKTPLHYASSSFKGSEVVKQLIKRGAGVSVVDNEGRTPLHYASSTSSSGSLQVAMQLIERGAGVSVVDNEGRTPLHYASSSAFPGSLEEAKLKLAKQLIEHGADVSIRDRAGQSPLDYAFSRRTWRIVKLLQESCQGGVRMTNLNS